jgi:N6-L-threonylcarbamoyladenine synthase
LKAAREHNLKRVIVSGGVGANKMLRKNLKKDFKGEVYYPRLEFCTDNAAMIAIAAAHRLNDRIKPNQIEAKARWPMEQINYQMRSQNG